MTDGMTQSWLEVIAWEESNQPAWNSTAAENTVSGSQLYCVPLDQLNSIG